MTVLGFAGVFAVFTYIAADPDPGHRLLGSRRLADPAGLRRRLARSAICSAGSWADRNLVASLIGTLAIAFVLLVADALRDRQQDRGRRRRRPARRRRLRHRRAAAAPRAGESRAAGPQLRLQPQHRRLQSRQCDRRLAGRRDHRPRLRPRRDPARAPPSRSPSLSCRHRALERAASIAARNPPHLRSRPNRRGPIMEYQQSRRIRPQGPGPQLRRRHVRRLRPAVRPLGHDRCRRGAPPGRSSASRPASTCSTPPTSIRRARPKSVLGEAIKGRRDKVLISTKTSLPMGDGPNECGTSPRAADQGGRRRAEAARHRLYRPAAAPRLRCRNADRGSAVDARRSSSRPASCAISASPTSPAGSS